MIQYTSSHPNVKYGSLGSCRPLCYGDSELSLSLIALKLKPIQTAVMPLRL